MITFTVTFPEHVSRDHREAYLNELLDIAEWRHLQASTYLLTPTRAARIADVRANLEAEQSLHRLAYQEEGLGRPCENAVRSTRR